MQAAAIEAKRHLALVFDNSVLRHIVALSPPHNF